MESCFISSLFGLHRSILHSCSDITVLLDLRECSWGLYGVPPGKSRLLICLIGNRELLCMQCRRIRPHIMARGNSHGFSRVAAGTWGIFSSYGGDNPSKLKFVQQRQDSSLGRRDSSGICSRLGRANRTLLEVRWETKVPFQVATVILLFLSIFNKCQASSPFEALNSTCLLRYQGCEPSCPDEVGI